MIDTLKKKKDKRIKLSVILNQINLFQLKNQDKDNLVMSIQSTTNKIKNVMLSNVSQKLK